jgi:hypothetical protein
MENELPDPWKNIRRMSIAPRYPNYYNEARRWKALAVAGWAVALLLAVVMSLEGAI